MQTQMELSDLLKEQGIEKAEKTARDQINDYFNFYFSHFKAFLSEIKSMEFQAEDFRNWLEKHDVIVPHGRNGNPTWMWLGGFMRRLNRLGIISYLKSDKTSNPRQHCANAGVWIRTI